MKMGSLRRNVGGSLRYRQKCLQVNTHLGSDSPTADLQWPFPQPGASAAFTSHGTTMPLETFFGVPSTYRWISPVEWSTQN